MASRWQRILAWLDRFISRVFYIDYEFISPGRDGAVVELRFYRSFGSKIAIIHPNRVVEIGRYFEVVHLYDGHNRLILRKRRKEMVGKGDRLIVGHIPGDPLADSDPLCVFQDVRGRVILIDGPGKKKNVS